MEDMPPPTPLPSSAATELRAATTNHLNSPTSRRHNGDALEVPTALKSSSSREGGNIRRVPNRHTSSTVVVAATATLVVSDDSDDGGGTAHFQSPNGTQTLIASSKLHSRHSFSLGELLGLFAVSFSYAFCFNTLNTIVIPKEIERLTSARQSMWVGLVMATGAVSQLATPIVGAWSDRAGGQRTPYLVYGTFIAILGIVFFVFAESFHEISFLMVAHVTTTIGLSVQYSMVTALLNDYVPEEHTGKGSGAMAILAIFGSGAGYLLFAFNAPLTYSYCAYILASVVCLGICVIYIPAAPPLLAPSSVGGPGTLSVPAVLQLGGTQSNNASASGYEEEMGGGASDGSTAGFPRGASPGCSLVPSTSAQEPRKLLAGGGKDHLSASATSGLTSTPPLGWIDSLLTPLSMPSPTRYPDFFFACSGRALFNSGLAGQVYLVYYLRDIIGASNPVQITSMVAVMALFGGIVGALPSGVVSDRVGKKPVIYGSITICVVTLLSFMVVRDVTTLHLVGFLYGVGNVAYLSVDYALGVQALPKRKGVPVDPAKDLGVFAMSATVGQLFGQVIYGAILDQYGTMTATGTQYNVWGFVVIYALGGMCFILSGISTSYLKNVR